MALLLLTRRGVSAAKISNSNHLRRHLLSPCPKHFSLHHDTNLSPPRISLPSPPPNPHLLQILDLIHKIRKTSSSRKEALAEMRDSGMDIPGELAAEAIWELRDDWESSLLAFQLSRRHRNPNSWHVIIRVLSRNRQFSLCWFLLRKMHRLKILSSSPFIILIQE